MKTDVKFNLNDYIRVKILPNGYQHWMDKWNLYMPEKEKQPLTYFTAQADEEGYCRFQAHEFIRTFGETVTVGFRQVFDINILIEVEQP